MELRQIRYFLAVAEELHFRRAAELVHVAQPALSQQIHKLEHEIGASLFERSHHKVLLTPAGKAFYEKARSLLNDAAQAILDARRAGCGQAGSINIGFVSTAAISILPAALKRLRQSTPAADVELRELATEEQIDSLYRGKLDIGFFHAKLTDETFDKLVIEKERLILALPASSPHARGRVVDLKKLAGETAILPAKHTTSGYYEHVRLAYQLAGVVPRRECHTRLLQTGILLVGAGLGVSLVPESFRSIRVKGAVYRTLSVEPPPLELTAAWRRDNNSPLLSRFVTELRAGAVG